MGHIKVQLFPNPKLGQLTLTKDSDGLSQHLRIKVGDVSKGARIFCCSLCAVRGYLLWESYFVVTWLVQSNEGQENLCLFCVYGSSGYSGISVPSASPAVNASRINQKYQEKCCLFIYFIFFFFLVKYDKLNSFLQYLLFSTGEHRWLSWG